MAKVTIYSTSSQSKRTIESHTTTWGALMSDMSAHGIPYHGMRAVVGETQHTLESAEAQLPSQGDYTIFLMPQKVKSGSDDHYLINFDGVEWSEVDWYDLENVPEDYQFKTGKDLAVARLKKVESYVQRVIEYLINERNKTPNDVEVQKLQYMAEQIKANLGIFD
jgi:hypothetical protein